MKKIMLCIVFIVILIIETSCRSVPFNGDVSNHAVSDGGVVAETVSGGSLSEDKEEKRTERKQGKKKSIDITFQDASGKKQELKTGEVDTTDMGEKMVSIVDGFVTDNHFYFIDWGQIVSDKRKKIIGDLGATSILDHMDMGLMYWCKYRGKLYFISDNIEGTNGDIPLLQFATLDLKSWKERIIDASEHYKEMPDDVYNGCNSIDNIFVYNDKIYIEDSFASDKLKEFDINGKQVRTLSIKNSGEKTENIVILGIMDEKIYFCTWDDNRHILRSKDMVTGKEKKVMQYEQPAYNKKKWSYRRPYFHLSGNNLFVEEYFCDADNFRKGNWDDMKEKSVLYWLPIKNGGKMKPVIKRELGEWDSYGNNIYYTDDNRFLHRHNIKTGTDKIISKRKGDDVICTKEGLFLYSYSEKDEDSYDNDEDLYEDDNVIYYVDFNGKHVKKIAES